MLIVRRRVTRLHSEEARALNQVEIVGNEHAAPGCSDDLVAVKGKDAAMALYSNLASVVSRPERLGRILDDRDVVTRTDIQDRLIIGALTVEIHDDNRAWQTAICCAQIQLLTQQRRIDIPGRLFRIDEDRRSAFVEDWVCACRERQGGADHFFAASQIKQS